MVLGLFLGFFKMFKDTIVWIIERCSVIFFVFKVDRRIFRVGLLIVFRVLVVVIWMVELGLLRVFCKVLMVIWGKVFLG